MKLDHDPIITACSPIMLYYVYIRIVLTLQQLLSGYNTRWIRTSDEVFIIIVLCQCIKDIESSPFIVPTDPTRFLFLPWS